MDTFEKTNPFTVTIRTSAGDVQTECVKPRRLSDLLADAGFPPDAPCGGHGKCGKCAVRATGALSPVSETERTRLGEDALSRGWRLACLTEAIGDAVVHYNIDISHLQGVTEGFSQDFAKIFTRCSFRPGEKAGTGMAIDIGTTTVAAYLHDLATGARLGALCRENPQRRHGADVISRMEYAMAGGGKELQTEIETCLRGLARDLCAAASLPAPDEWVVTGNTTMLHLATGTDPASLSAAPFTVRRYFGETVKEEKGSVYYPRCISAYVGADITTAVFASGMTAHSETALLVDVGTNGEMALWHGGKLLCCSTAAGPAFEGAGISCGSLALPGAVCKVSVAPDGKTLRYETVEGTAPTGLCGTGLIDTVAALLRTGVLEGSGFLEEDAPIGDSGLSLTRGDVRQLQLAKSAIRSGMDTLLALAGIRPEEVDTLYLAGGFGSYLHPDTCAAIGLFPPVLTNRIRVLGNAAGNGACALLLSAEARREAESLACRAETVELSASPVFMEKYVENMFFGEE